jgi:hypothetical protein
MPRRFHSCLGRKRSGFQPGSRRSWLYLVVARRSMQKGSTSLRVVSAHCAASTGRRFGGHDLELYVLQLGHDLQRFTTALLPSLITWPLLM